MSSQAMPVTAISIQLFAAAVHRMVGRTVDTRDSLREPDVRPSRVSLLPAQILDDPVQVVVKPRRQFMANGTNFVRGWNR